MPASIGLACCHQDIAKLQVNSINCYQCLALHDHKDLVAFEVGVVWGGRAEVLCAEVKHVVDVCVNSCGTNIKGITCNAPDTR